MADEDTKQAPTSMKGGCLCGAIRYELIGCPKYSGLCYCGDCRKSSGSAFVAFMGFESQNFKITGNVEPKRYSNKSANDGPRDINFCPLCCSLLFGGVYGQDKEHTVYAGTLDNEFIDLFEPKMAIFTRIRPKWGKLTCEMMEYETMPFGG